MYDHASIEPKWQRKWLEAGVFKAQDNDVSRAKFYVLDMFPYPSAAGLHVGHPEGYTASDIIARMKRMQGMNVLHPMGWDAFGLPAENYAIKTGVHPRVTTQKSIEAFRRQIQSLGFSYDWDREINTTDPAYYKWTQWIFLQLYKKGLAYEAVAPINFCPSCKTGLANEEVHQGACERCGTPVEKKKLRQWILKITAYADRLLEDLEGLDWPESTLAMQRNWIGRSEGAEVDFGEIRIFTTRPDTLFGATYMVLAPEHPLVDKITAADKKAEVSAYREAAAKKTDMERSEEGRKKTGVFTGGFAVNPVSGEKIPVWIADYVLMHYGTGAIMAVPAHDQRDWEFAKTYNLPIKQVVSGKADLAKGAFTEEGTAINSGPYNGMSTSEFKKRITQDLESRGLGKKAVTYKLRDWIFSRQRYWGEPIPIIHCKKCGTVPVPDNQLPVALPEVERYQPTGTGESPLAAIKEWVNVNCPVCSGPAERETNTMPQWGGSCWYYLRFMDPGNPQSAWDKAKEKYWGSVDLYIGGAEHAVLHLLYSRFWHKVLFDLGWVSTKEPYMKLRHQGMILSYSYQDKMGVYHGYEEIELTPEGGKLKATGEILAQKVEKMSKSKKNVVNPDDVIRQYGADVMRLYEMFMGDFELSKPWDMRTVGGVARFLDRAWRVIENFEPGKVAPQTHEKLRHKSIQAVETRIEAFKFNTAITALMEYVNAMTAEGASEEDLDVFLRILSPFAPHLAEEGWEKLGRKGFVSTAPWPKHDPKLMQEDSVPVPVQINGKVKETILVAAADIRDQARVAELARLNDKVGKLIQNAKVKKVIYVPGKVLNFVIDGQN